MIKQLLYILILTLLMSCGQGNNKVVEQNQGNLVIDSLSIMNDLKNNLNIQTTSFSEIDSSGVLMFPLSVTETEKSDGSFSYKESPNDSYWNIIFYNSKTKEYHLLSERKMLITAYDYQYKGSGQILDNSQTENYIFYTILIDDFNKDGKITHRDPSYLFVSDKLGNNFKQISPTGYDLFSWRFVKKTNKVIVTAKKDSDNNKKFDAFDETIGFEIELNKEMESQKIFADEFKNKLKILFERDWKQAK